VTTSRSRAGTPSSATSVSTAKTGAAGGSAADFEAGRSGDKVAVAPG